jgi:hypothetical protein
MAALPPVIPSKSRVLVDSPKVRLRRMPNPGMDVAGP